MLTSRDYDNTAGHFQQLAKGAPNKTRSQTTTDACISKKELIFRHLLTSILSGSRLGGAGWLLSSVEGEKERAWSLLSSTMSTTANNRTQPICRKVGVAPPILNANLSVHVTIEEFTCTLSDVTVDDTFELWPSRWTWEDTPTSIKKRSAAVDRLRISQLKSWCRDLGRVGTPRRDTQPER